MEREVLFISVLLFFPSEKKGNERSQRICRWQDLVTLTPLFKKILSFSVKVKIKKAKSTIDSVGRE